MQLCVLSLTKDTVQESDESAITFGDTVILAKKNSTITVPETNEIREGFTALKWTTLDGKLYKPGKNYTVGENEYLFIRWKRTDMHSLFIVDSK